MADLIVVPGDPLKDLELLRRPLHVLVDGRLELADGQPRLADPPAVELEES
jgi:imidazolonepropionase-like amidohydrolase